MGHLDTVLPGQKVYSDVPLNSLVMIYVEMGLEFRHHGRSYRLNTVVGFKLNFENNPAAVTAIM
jgi:hypothetical protein